MTKELNDQAVQLGVEAVILIVPEFSLASARSKTANRKAFVTEMQCTPR